MNDSEWDEIKKSAAAIDEDAREWVVKVIGRPYWIGPSGDSVTDLMDARVMTSVVADDVVAASGGWRQKMQLDEALKMPWELWANSSRRRTVAHALARRLE